MQRVAPASESRQRRPRKLAGVLMAFVLGTSLLFSPGALAQDATPEATPEGEPTGATVTDLVVLDVDEFPTAPVSVRLLRLTLAPGASSPMHTHPGHEFDYVESGTLTVDSIGEANIIRDGEQSSAELAGEQFEAGALVHFPPGVGMFLQNTSSEDVVLLSAVFHPVNEDVPSTEYVDGPPSDGAFDGVSFVVLGDGIIQSFPEGAATISLQEVVVPAAAPLPGSTGAALYSLVAGDFAFAVQEGSVQVSRTASPGLRPNAAIDQEFTLAPADAAFFPAGVVEADRSSQEGEMTILRLFAEPSSGAEGTPATIQILLPEEDPSALAPGELGVGAVVVTTTGPVNIRSEPTTSADVVEQAAEGVQMLVLAGPAEADDFVWWQVQLVNNESIVGWVVQDFITVEGAEPVEETPEPTEDPTATDDATPTAEGVFAQGDIVATVEESVRLRDEPSINGEPIDAFPLGTQFEITGAPVDADDFTWYPVTQLGGAGLSGWTVEDFLELVDDDGE